MKIKLKIFCSMRGFDNTTYLIMYTCSNAVALIMLWTSWKHLRMARLMFFYYSHGQVSQIGNMLSVFHGFILNMPISVFLTHINTSSADGSAGTLLRSSDLLPYARH